MARVSVETVAHRRLVEDLEVVCRLVIWLELASLKGLLVRRRHHGANAWIADEIPSDEAGVSAVIRIAECPLVGVTENHVEELTGVTREARGRTGLDVAQHGILVGRRKLGEQRAPRRTGVSIERREG